MSTVSMRGLFDMLGHRFVRFLVVGGMNTGFSYGLYVVLVWAGMHFVVANLLATAAGILFSFRTQGRFVFGNTDGSLFSRFVPAWILLWLLNVGLITALVRWGQDPYSAGALALVPTVAVSYFVQKHFVFKAPPSHSPSRPK